MLNWTICIENRNDGFTYDQVHATRHAQDIKLLIVIRKFYVPVVLRSSAFYVYSPAHNINIIVIIKFSLSNMNNQFLSTKNNSPPPSQYQHNNIHL